MVMTEQQREAKREYDRARHHRLRAELRAVAGPDPIELLDDTTVAYLAGLTDADGSIYVTHTNRLRTYYPNVVWAMTHRPTIEWVATTVRGRSIVHNNHTSRRRGSTSWGQSEFKIQ